LRPRLATGLPLRRFPLAGGWATSKRIEAPGFASPPRDGFALIGPSPSHRCPRPLPDRTYAHGTCVHPRPAPLPGTLNGHAASRSRFKRRLRFHRHDGEQTIRSDRLGVNSPPHSTQRRGVCTTTRRGAHPPHNRRGRPRPFRTNGALHRSHRPSSAGVAAALSAGAVVTSRSCRSPCRARGRTEPRRQGRNRRPETRASNGKPANPPSPGNAIRSSGRSIRTCSPPVAVAPFSADVGRTCRGCPTSPSRWGCGAARTGSPHRPGSAPCTAGRPRAVGCRGELPRTTRLGGRGFTSRRHPRPATLSYRHLRNTWANAFLSGTTPRFPSQPPSKPADRPNPLPIPLFLPWVPFREVYFARR
jgi:hypothetical protein